MSRSVRPTAKPVYGRSFSAPRRRNYILRHPYVGLVALGLVAVIYTVLCSGWFEITTINVVGNRATPTSSIAAVVNHTLDAHAWDRNLWLVNTAQVKSAVEASNYALQVSNVDRQFPHTLNLTIAEHQSALYWQSNNSTYVLDDTGTAIAAVLDHATPPRLPLVTDESNLPIKPGDRVVPPVFVSFVQELIGKFSLKESLAITGLSIQDTTMDLTIKTKLPYVIKFDTTRSVDENLYALTQTLNELAKEKKTPTQYIDLRVPNRAFYK